MHKIKPYHYNINREERQAKSAAFLRKIASADIEMQIDTLTLKNFRNYADETFQFAPGLNVLYGKNAQGKTNCAEALFYLCTGTSFRTKKDRQLIREGEEHAHIFASARTRFGSVTIEADIFETKREVRINGGKIARNADLLGNIDGVFFSPAELRLIQDGPDERRRFLNVSLSQLSRAYYTALVRYNRILLQRNKLLKERDFAFIMDTLPVWDEQLCRYAAEIVLARQDYVRRLSPLAAEKHAFLTGSAEQLQILPEKSWGESREQIEEGLRREFSQNYERDVRLGFTASGPHRDDLKILIDGKEARAFGSQGQMRTAALALKLAEVDIFTGLAGEPPVLILDDVMSELDLARRRKLLSAIGGVQTVLTCTHTEKVLQGRQVQKVRIAAGAIVPAPARKGKGE